MIIKKKRGKKREEKKKKEKKKDKVANYTNLKLAIYKKGRNKKFMLEKSSSIGIFLFFLLSNVVSQFLPYKHSKFQLSIVNVNTENVKYSLLFSILPGYQVPQSSFLVLEFPATLFAAEGLGAVSEGKLNIFVEKEGAPFSEDKDLEVADVDDELTTRDYIKSINIDDTVKTKINIQLRYSLQESSNYQLEFTIKNPMIKNKVGAYLGFYAVSSISENAFTYLSNPSYILIGADDPPGSFVSAGVSLEKSAFSSDDDYHINQFFITNLKTMEDSFFLVKDL